MIISSHLDHATIQNHKPTQEEVHYEKAIEQAPDDHPDGSNESGCL